MTPLILKALVFISWFTLVYLLCINGVYLLMNILSLFVLRRTMLDRQTIELKRVFHSIFYKPISILVPAHNEEKNIAQSVHALLHMEFPEYEVVVINDGSTDETLAKLQETFDLVEVPRTSPNWLKTKRVRRVFLSRKHSHLLVVDKENGGKADALNCGINWASFPLFCSIDSDSILDPDSLLKTVRPFIEDPTVVAVGGVIRVANGCRVEKGIVQDVCIPKSNLARFQIVEYLRAFLFGRVGWDAFSALLVISGAFGLFHRKAVVEAGGYREGCVGEDMELVVRLHRFLKERKQNYRVTFVPDPICWTEVPEKIRQLARQRNRWQRGLMESLLLHIKMLFNPRYGTVGLMSFPFFFFFEMFGPVVEMLGYGSFCVAYSWGALDFSFASLFFAAAVLFGVIISTSALCLEEISFKRYPRLSHILLLFGYSVVENFGYRQLTTFFRFHGFLDFCLGKKAWGKMERKGL